jgi:hypothetical protein
VGQTLRILKYTLQFIMAFIPLVALMFLVVSTLTPILVIFGIPILMGLTDERWNIMCEKGMTLGEWIISNIPAEETSSHQRRIKRRYCKKYITTRHKGSAIKIACKRAKYRLQGPIYIACPAQQQATENMSSRPTECCFDSDSFDIGIDTHASCAMSNDAKHFVGKVQKVKQMKVKGISGMLDVKWKGMVQWQIEDDDGKKHQFTIHNALYVPGLPTCLMCPQQWIKQANDHYPRRHGTMMEILGDVCILRWKQREFQQMIPWNLDTNVGTIRSAAGANAY